MSHLTKPLRTSNLTSHFFPIDVSIGTTETSTFALLSSCFHKWPQPVSFHPVSVCQILLEHQLLLFHDLILMGYLPDFISEISHGELDDDGAICVVSGYSYPVYCTMYRFSPSPLVQVAKSLMMSARMFSPVASFIPYTS